MQSLRSRLLAPGATFFLGVSMAVPCQAGWGHHGTGLGEGTAGARAQSHGTGSASGPRSSPAAGSGVHPFPIRETGATELMTGVRDA